MNAIAGLLAPVPPPSWSRLLERLTLWPGSPVSTQTIDGVTLASHALPSTPEDLSERQPAACPNGRFHIVWDGRIDNRAELLRDLPGPHSDASLALAAWAQWGAAAPARMLGDFAFAVWDSRERRLHCVRDPMAWRPLFYAETPAGFAFASELAPLLELFPAPPKRNEAMVAEFLSGYFTTAEETLYEGIYRLPAGIILTAGGPSLQLRSFWQPDFTRELRLADDQEYAEHFRTHFTAAVQSRLRSAGPVASHISGGIDSTTVSVTAAGIHAGPANWQTLSITYPGRTCDESPLINDVCRAAGLANRQFPGGPLPLSYFTSRARALSDFPGYPNFEASSEPIYAHARQSGITVLLSGLGGNQWFEGDTSFLADTLADGRWLESLSKARRLWGRPGPGWLRFWLDNAFRPALPPRLRPGWWNLPRPNLPWLAPGYAARSGLLDRVSDYRRRRITQRGARPEQAHLFERLNAPFEMQCREYAERGSRHMGVEVRHPFYDRRLVEFALSLPAAQRWSGGQAKYIVRNAMRGCIPPSVLDRRIQAEFSSVYADAVNFPEWETTLQSGFLSQRLHPAGRRPVEQQVQRCIQNPDTEPFDVRAWRWFALALWDTNAP